MFVCFLVCFLLIQRRFWHFLLFNRMFGKVLLGYTPDKNVQTCVQFSHDSLTGIDFEDVFCALIKSATDSENVTPSTTKVLVFLSWMDVVTYPPARCTVGLVYMTHPCHLPPSVREPAPRRSCKPPIYLAHKSRMNLPDSVPLTM